MVKKALADPVIRHAPPAPGPRQMWLKTTCARRRADAQGDARMPGEQGPTQPDQGRDRRLGSRDRAGGARPGRLQGQAVLGRLDGVRRRAQQPRVAGRCGHARHAAGDQRRPASPRPCAPGSASRRRSICVSVFDRKNYFYPDLPQGYQISQYKQPDRRRGRGGGRASTARRCKVGIERLHLEQDAGKSIHDQHPEYSYVDLNRSGVALMEIVSKPDMRSAKQAQAYVSQAAHHPALSRHLRRRHGEGQPARRRQRLGAPAGRASSARAARSRTSTRSASSARPSRSRRAARSRSSRTAAAIEQETRLFDPRKGETRSMRSKEEAHDYRYFPDPDLLPLELTQAYVEGLKKGLPELPDAKTAALHARLRAVRLRRRRAGGRARERRVLRGGGQGARRQDWRPTG